MLPPPGRSIRAEVREGGGEGGTAPGKAGEHGLIEDI